MVKKKSTIQSVMFDNEIWNTTQARKWLKNNNLKPMKRVDKTENYLRYRMIDPSQFKKFRIITLKGVKGIKFVLGF